MLISQKDFDTCKTVLSEVALHSVIAPKPFTFCKMLLHQIFRGPTAYKQQQCEMSQIIKIKRKTERYFWINVQFFLVTFTLNSSKNMVTLSQLNQTEPTLLSNRL